MKNGDFFSHLSAVSVIKAIIVKHIFGFVAYCQNISLQTAIDSFLIASWKRN